jgi:uncharacterized protein YceH (UPF0502 family)
MNPMSNLRALSLFETRVLGVLSEKQRTVPDSYPLTLNALVSGCNQKTSRNPIVEISDADVQATLDSLKTLSLVTESSGGRVYRYGHNLDGVLKIPSQSIVLLTVLMLRGPQTPGELRVASERMHNFADVSSVEGFLDELTGRASGPLVRKLPRLPGARESRWTHLLGGAPAAIETGERSNADAVDLPAGEAATLTDRVARLETELAVVKGLLGRVCSELGIDASS